MKYLIICCFLLFNKIAFAQNIFDAESNTKYAHYLNDHKDFEHLLAVLNELEIQQPDSINIKFWKAQCYLNLGKTTQAYNYVYAIKSNNTYKNELDFLRLKTGILLDSFEKYSINQFDINNKSIAELYCVNAFYLNGKDSAILLTNKLIIDKKRRAYLLRLFNESTPTYGLKKPWLASVLSIVPGLGQIYTKQYSDAFLGMIPIYTFGAISVFSFSKYGTQSVFGWVNMGMSTGFYLGNIYGAYQSAKRINSINFKETNDEIKKHIADLGF